MEKTESRIPTLFDPEAFRNEGHKLVDTLSDYLKGTLSGTEMPVLPWNEPDKLSEMFSFESGGGEDEPFDSFMKRTIDLSIHIHHPNYIGHQVTSEKNLRNLLQRITEIGNSQIN
jgi:L-2,4-diaminobutyrate decarboxylase